MSRPICVGVIAFFTLTGFAALAQTSALLHTSDTDIAVEAGSETPRLVSLSAAGQPAWENRVSESLVASAQISSQLTSIHWTFNREASQISAAQVRFVYDSASPHLRLAWEWRTRADF